jgi:hypothetical protein
MDYPMELRNCGKEICAIKKRAELLVVGEKVRILSDFNGQAFGNSKPSLKGQIFIVAEVMVDDDYDIYLWDGDNEHCFINLNEIEFIGNN